MVNSQVQAFENRGDFELTRGDFVVTGFGRNAKAPQLGVEIFHEGDDTGFDRAEVVVFRLLMLGGLAAEQGAAGLLQVEAGVIELFVDQEVFLFRTERGVSRLLAGNLEQLGQTFGLNPQRFHGAKKRSLFVEGLAVIAAEYGRDAEGAVLDESRAAGIPAGIAAGFEGGAQTA